MDKVKTLIENLEEGYEKAFYSLDKRVNDLQALKIKNISDTLYPIGGTLDNRSGYIERIVIYNEYNSVKTEGEPWKPALDMDLMDFIGAAQPPRRVKATLEEAYAQGKKSIRDLLSMTYGWYSEIGWGGKKHWESIKNFFEKYGFILKEEGNVIKD